MNLFQDATSSVMQDAEQLYDRLDDKLCPGDVLLDDRVHLGVGARVREAAECGYPATILIGGKVRKLLSVE